MLKDLDPAEVTRILKDLKAQGIESLAISLMHSYQYSAHEQTIRDLAKAEGFKYVAISSQVSGNIGYLARTSTTVLDAYLNPILSNYVEKIVTEFDAGIANVPIYFMQSDGTLVLSSSFRGCKAILSGPAGGMIGYSATASNMSEKIIGFDMGGTSTDVSTYEGSFELNYETEIADVFIQSSHLDINTVAAGGGSRLVFKNQMLQVGPESAGSNPGPVCYGNDGVLAITDANLVLGRIRKEYFPKIFGKDQDQPLDDQKSMTVFNSTQLDISKNFVDLQGQTAEDLAMGYVKVANEVMCRPIRALTEARGKELKHYMLSVFGGAGSQHACSVARNLNLKKIFIHQYSSVLSAVGIFLADISEEENTFIAKELHEITNIDTDIYENGVRMMASNAEKMTRGNLGGKSFEEVFGFLLKNTSSEAVICVNLTKAELFDYRSDGKNVDLMAHLKTEFERKHKESFGFILEEKPILLQSITLRSIMKRDD